MRQRVRSVTMGERGQIVIPEAMRKDLKLGKGDTLVLVERGNAILVRKEADVVKVLSEDEFWDTVATDSLQRAWDAEDHVWDKIAPRR